MRKLEILKQITLLANGNSQRENEREREIKPQTLIERSGKRQLVNMTHKKSNNVNNHIIAWLSNECLQLNANYIYMNLQIFIILFRNVRG